MGNHLLRGDGGVAGRGMGVRHQYDRVAERQGAAGGGIDAEFRVHAAHDQFFYLAAGQDTRQLSIQKRVWRRLSHLDIGRFDVQSAGKLPGIGAAFQIPGCRFVLDEDNRRTGSPGLARDLVDARYRPLVIERRVAALAKSLLYIDHQYSHIHRASSLNIHRSDFTLWPALKDRDGRA